MGISAARRAFLGLFAAAVGAISTEFMRGRKPIPTVLKLVSGNPGRRALPKDEPVPLGELHAPPETFTERQKEIWRHAIDNAPKGLLRRLDSRLLQIWVVAADMHETATLNVQKYGMVVKSPNAGVPVQSPYLPIINRQAEIMMRASSELGFSPTSRSRIELAGAGAGKEANRFSKHASANRRA